MKPRTTCLLSPGFHVRTASKSHPPTRLSGSMLRSNGEPTSSASFRTTRLSLASSVRCCSSRTTNGNCSGDTSRSKDSERSATIRPNGSQPSLRAETQPALSVTRTPLRGTRSINTYHELHFSVIGEVYKHPRITRREIWMNLRGAVPRDDSDEADLFRLLIRDLSTGGVVRQERETDFQGRFLKQTGHRGGSQGSSVM